MLRHLLESLRSAVAYDAAGIFVLSRTVPLSASRGVDVIAGVARVGFEAPRFDDPMLRFGKGITGHVIQTGEVVLVPDVRRDPRYVAGREATLSEVAVPIISNGEVIGALNLESDRTGAFDAQDVELLEFFASAAALAIEKALLHRQVVEKERLEQQLRVARDVQSSLLPAASPELRGYEFAAVNLPSWAVGGDYFDYLPMPPHYLGPSIVATGRVAGAGIEARPVRIKFCNLLPTGPADATGRRPGDLFLPTDETVMGAGYGPAGPGTAGETYTQNRAAVHLHGNNTVWISDGTPHQWITPAGETTNYPKGVSVRNVPDMWFDPVTHATVPAGTPGATNDPGPGSLTIYYTNAMSARLMFYNDHAMGITRLNVYAGEAAGYVLRCGRPGPSSRARSARASAMLVATWRPRRGEMRP